MKSVKEQVLDKPFVKISNTIKTMANPPHNVVWYKVRVPVNDIVCAVQWRTFEEIYAELL